ncbi:protein ENHANCED DISEASE RESISTANCE 2 isoform X1 [Citrus clementina]|uniref:protein ENHANCED DISEASE RESISTANCE 2 isoform X1 n=1 Tax=Citrus clementina TaxID=85681 RepID=UPI000CED7EE8|nr:protein ENHANCED DISEASE RESISTANCE 2 isoform X1 [Citrus x clementina]XP_024040426.1 protein ENHANCED DISEASE RESISTANCE 2 isoform X1 [Citrus x clementina]XP_024040427.1 protein ENHANCED DISEASE RESISTANCE 2 isoform X1 [Citrus x clementina]
MSFNTIADAVSTCHLVSAIQFPMSRSGFGAMLSAVCGFKIKSCLFDGIDSIVEDWIVDQMHLKGGGTIDLEPYLTHSSTTEPTLAPMAVERTTTTRAATSVGLVAALEEEQADQIDLSCFSGNLRHDDCDNARDCWKLSDGNNFRVRSKHFCYDKTKLQIPAGKHLMDLVAVDWFKDTKRMDHVARRQGCAAQVASEKGLFSLIFNLQVPGSTHYSMVF